MGGREGISEGWRGEGRGTEGVRASDDGGKEGQDEEKEEC